jgi:enamine deaminase RidA (YjgF/YER057c/UK114 family)
VTIADRLKELGITLPQSARPVANYLPAVQANGFLFLAGQVPLRDGQLVVKGKVGGEVSLEEAQEAARVAVLNALAAARDALDGDLDRVVRVVRAVVYINAVPDFTQHGQVGNGASDLLISILGENGRHARSSIGMGSLPLGAPVEVELTLQVGG